MLYRLSTANALHNFCVEHLLCLVVTHNMTSPSTSTCTTYYSPHCTTLLWAQITNRRHSWQNSTRCKDGVKVLWYRSHLVFGSYMHLFSFRNFFVADDILFVECVYLQLVPSDGLIRKHAHVRTGRYHQVSCRV